jgi:phosphomannomutase
VAEVIREHGGEPIRTQVGHSTIKAEMARTGAIFGGEHSAHYYFRDFWFADTGLLAAMHVLAELGATTGRLDELVEPYARYVASGEINSSVADTADRLAAVHDQFASDAASVDDLDGLTITLADGSWFNVRASNTEPLLRLNVEALTPQAMTELRDTVLDVIRK